MPRCQCNEGLNRKIKLGAEAAADGSGNNAYSLGSDTENSGNVSAVHVGGLGAGLNLDLVTHAARKPGFRLDVGVLDEASFVFASTTTSDSARAFSTSPRTTRPRTSTLFSRSVDKFARRVRERPRSWSAQAILPTSQERLRGRALR